MSDHARWKGNLGPVVFACPVPVPVGARLPFEQYPTVFALVLRAATVEEFWASRAEREEADPSAALVQRCARAYFYEVQAD